MNILFARELWLPSASEIETSVYFVLQTYSDLAPNKRETVRDMESGTPGLQFGEVNFLCWRKVSRTVVKCPCPHLNQKANSPGKANKSNVLVSAKHHFHIISLG